MPSSRNTPNLPNHHSTDWNQEYTYQFYEHDRYCALWPTSRHIEPPHNTQGEKQNTEHERGNHLPGLGNRRDNAADEQ